MGFPRSATTSVLLPAWQPLTFGGVAAFARASFGRTALVTTTVALVLTGLTLRFVASVWAPAVDLAIARLPASGAVDHGRLVWPSAQSAVLVNNAFIAISVRPPTGPAPDQSADLQFEFAPAALKVSSLLGYLELPYPPGAFFPLNRAELEPLWGAWRPHLLLGIAAATFLGLVSLWTVLACVLILPLRSYALLLGRAVTLGGCWRLALAALLPGALIMGGALIAYGLRRLSLGEVLLANALHLLVDAAYLLISPLQLPDSAPASPFAGSPFAEPTPAEPGTAPSTPPDAPPENPFQVGRSADEPPPPTARAPRPNITDETDNPLNPS